MWYHKGLSILPNVNLVSNIGFGPDATHTIEESELANLKSFEIELKNHPKEIERNLEADEFTSKYHFSQKSILERILNKVKRIVKVIK